MKTILKYEIKVVGEQEIKLPLGWEFLCLQLQNRTIQLCALVETSQPDTELSIKIVGTGHAFKDAADWLYLGTVQIDDFVLHVFCK